MKRHAIIVLGLVGCVVVLTCGLAVADIKGSKHDFSSDKWEGIDKCGICHPAEGEEPAAPPLWNTNADLSRRFGRPVPADPAQPGVGTLVCLQCHDGTLAKDVSGATIDTRRFVNRKHTGPIRAGHGRTDHPVGVEYPRFDREYHPENKVLAEGCIRLPNGNVECISCHDPHDGSGQPHMLVMSNARSALCLACHRK